MGFIAGAYTVQVRKRVAANLEGTLGAPTYTTVGQIEDGITLDYTKSWEPIRGDNMGDSVQDGVFRGGDCFMDFTLLEWNLALISTIFWPDADAAVATDVSFVNFGKLESGKIGRLVSTMAVPIRLTKVTGPNASPHYVWAALSILAPGYPVRVMFAPRLRRLPIRLQLLPYQRTAGVANPFYWFEGTDSAAPPAEIED